MTKDFIRQSVNVLAFIGTVVVNGLANALPLNGQTTGEISNRFPVYFVPAGYVFSIWSVIYLLLLGFTIYQALPKQRDHAAVRRIGYLPALTGVLNSAWIFLWHYEQWLLTVLVMATLLLTLIAIYLRLNIGRTSVGKLERWFLHLPFSVYLGWITVATIANITTVLYIAQWDGFGLNGQIWAVIMLIVGALITGAIIVTRRDIAYTLVILWAYISIVVKQIDTRMVADAAAITAALIAVLLCAVLYFPRYMSPQRQMSLPQR